jgi:predicted DNA-binding protein
MSIQIRITVSKEINDLLQRVSKKLGKKKSMLARELMEQKLYDLDLIQRELNELDKKNE